MNTNTIKIRGNKNKILAITLIAIFAMSLVMTLAPTALAQPGIAQPRQSEMYISISPHLIGVGQQLTVNYWIAPTPTGYSTSPWYGPPPGFQGTSVTFTRPDGTTDTFKPQQTTGNYAPGQTDALGALVFFYAPNMAGNWSVTCSMPVQNFTDASGTVLYTASTSSPAYFTVTTQQQNAGVLNGWPFSPLPNSNAYWTYPLSPNNREWASIASPMFPQTLGGYWQPYGSAPSTPHIVWQVQGGLGGIIGGDVGNLALQGSGNAPIIMLGKVYISGINNLGGVNCYDLTTGNLLWSSNNSITRPIIIPGNIYSQAIEETQQSGVVLAGSTAPTAYLFGTSTGPTIKGLATTNWNYINPLTGLITAQYTNATGGTGTMTDYSFLVFGQLMTNQSPVPPYYEMTNYIWGWNYSKVTGNDWYTGLMWQTNVSRHWGGVNTYGPGDGSGRTGFSLSADMSTIVVGGGPGDLEALGFSTATGQSKWNTTFNYVSLGIPIQLYNTNDFITSERVGGETFRCYSILTGALLWTVNDVGINDWVTQFYDYCNDANNMYINSPDGTVTALSIATGSKLWTSTPILTTEEVTNALPAGWHDYGIVAGGLVYVYLGYSTGYEQEPIPRFSVTICINATTGATVWILNGGNNPKAECSGYLFTTGTFNGIISCIGKGQTSTAISVQNNVVTEGSTALITGNVLDQSPAQPGTPAVSDASQPEWMDYLHMQNATLLNNPPQEQGVQVTLTAVDPNNNTITLGTTTSDWKGNYGLSFVPTTTGMYTITASFAGSNSYWTSNADAKMTVVAAHAATSSTVTTTSPGVSDTTLYTAVAAIIVVIIIVGAAIIILQRKKP